MTVIAKPLNPPQAAAAMTRDAIPETTGRGRFRAFRARGHFHAGILAGPLLLVSALSGALYVVTVRDYRQALARKMEERRRELGLTYREVWRRGGPADSTQADLENAGLGLVLPSNFRKVDTGLDWEPGTAASLFHTGKHRERIEQS